MMLNVRASDAGSGGSSFAASGMMKNAKTPTAWAAMESGTTDQTRDRF
jgi:hypothetical protein